MVNNMEVINFSPESARELALVDLVVLQRLTNMLEATSFERIRHNLRTELMESTNLETIVQICDNFSAFHKSVNLISNYKREELTSMTDTEGVTWSGSNGRDYSIDEL